MLKKAVAVLIVSSTLALVGCGDQDKVVACPTNGEAFFKSSIDGYYAKHDKAKIGNYKLEPGERYDAKNNWWVVPYSLDGTSYLAMMSCDGRTELSVGKP
ncbi:MULTISPECIES: hypothetical protein [Pseudomonas syringae group]|uniref:Lipoprotein n=3 Tax=Pseudomonas syringae group TaxID=136849 RepID=A0AAD0DSV6_9PSED|nr:MULTISPECIES: hypothetical protein [Pseudomonas syringae group]AVB17859.1 hypothetical protein BKM03_00055 [Pseudomonas avellanae]EGH10511.1 hypothetical protein PSYMP_13809 [Pseudomonas amygdali pv. morsprunorum str. M302280]KWS72942.1 hypothetical protein AL055_11790 [Pseudomonas amygdali pv. morsprunorum]PHN41193.1 hypothetical protein AO261_10885 [Pseudomonas avellanae]POC81760.1 hypothetical protein BKM26_28350 [Pseudomonas avellanae]